MNLYPDIDHVTQNIKQGGFDQLHLFDEENNNKITTPKRAEILQRNFQELGRQGVNSLTIIDAYGWGEYHKNNEAIAKILGTKNAFFQPLNDDRVTAIYGKGAGNVYATNNKLEKAEGLDLGDRLGILSVEEVPSHIGSKIVQTASLYITDINAKPHQQHDQIDAAVNALGKNMNYVDLSIVTGDFNAPPQNMKGAPLRSKLFDDPLIRATGAFSLAIPGEQLYKLDTKRNFLRTIGYYALFFRTLNTREVHPTLESRGYRNADTTKQPTGFKWGIGTMVDHTYYKGVLENVVHTAYPANSASDHSAIRLQANFQPKSRQHP